MPQMFVFYLGLKMDPTPSFLVRYQDELLHIFESHDGPLQPGHSCKYLLYFFGHDL